MNLFQSFKSAAVRTWDVIVVAYNYVVGSAFEGANYSQKRGHAWNARLQHSIWDSPAEVREELQRKSGHLEKNNALFNRLCDLFELYVVGSGLQITPSSSDPVFNAIAKRSHDGWSKFADLTSRQTFDILQSLWARGFICYGGTFINLTYGEPDRDGRRRPRLQTFEAMLCQNPPEPTEYDIDGVRVDIRGRPIAYWFRTLGPGQKDGFKLIEAEGMSPGGGGIIHLWEPSRPGQVRELPMATPVLNDFQDLWELDLLEMEAAKIHASRTDVVTTGTGELDPDMARRMRLTGATGTTVTQPDGTVAAVKSVTQVAPVVIKQGEKFEQFISDRPSVVSQEYYRTREEKACAGIGIPRVLAFPDSMQGTVYRGALDMANAWFRARFGIMADVVRRIYAWRLDWAINNEPEFRAYYGTGKRPADWDSVSIAQPRAVNVDVGRNSAAMLNELAAGATTYDGIYAPLGKDWREEFRKLKEQQDYAREIGLVIPGAAPVASGVDGAADASAVKAEPLNGAQITAAIDVLVKLREQTLSATATLELLVGIGVERTKAENIIKDTPVGMDNGAGDTAFKREVLKQLLTVPAAREAVYNGVDIEDLIAQTGLQPETGYEVPYIPVIAPNGPLVNGDTIKDPQGDVVGGDIEEPETETPDAPEDNKGSA